MSDKISVMCDLETLDTKPSAVILSIGACQVERNGKISNKFYRVLHVEGQSDLGRTQSASTVAWWDQQSEEARKVFSDPKTVPFENGLLDFRTYLSLLGYYRDIELWGNGSDFDNTILTSAYDSVGLSTPWAFYNNRCFRTMRSQFKDHIKEPERPGTYHNALDDAVYQADILAQIWRHIDGN